jgi:hypothetical protein
LHVAAIDCDNLARRSERQERMLSLRYREDRKVRKAILDESTIGTGTESTSFSVGESKDIPTSEVLDTGTESTSFSVGGSKDIPTSEAPV